MELIQDEYLHTGDFANIIIDLGEHGIYDEVCMIWYHNSVNLSRQSRFEDYIGRDKIVQDYEEADYEYIFFYDCDHIFVTKGDIFIEFGFDVNYVDGVNGE